MEIPRFSRYCSEDKQSKDLISSDPQDNNEITANFVYNLAKEHVINDRMFYIMDSKTLETLRSTLDNVDVLSFADFKILRENQPPEFATKYMNAKIFLSLPRNADGMISSRSFMNYVQTKVDTEKTILQLWFYDRSGKGVITEFDLYSYIGCIMPKMSVLGNMPDKFHDWYISIAARKFFFFLDSKRKFSISILRLATSYVMSEFLALRRLNYPYDSSDKSKLVYAEISSSWFSYESALSVYTQFVELDKDDDGYLNAADLKRFSGILSPSVSLTPAAIDRIVTVYSTTRLENGQQVLDFGQYVDLVLAFTFKKSFASLLYFWRLLDLNSNNCFTLSAIRHFYPSLCDCLRSNIGISEVPTCHDVEIEVFDMIQPPSSSSTCVTLQDLLTMNPLTSLSCTALPMLLDVNLFWSYETRENPQQPAEQPVDPVVEVVAEREQGKMDDYDDDYMF